MRSLPRDKERLLLELIAGVPLEKQLTGGYELTAGQAAALEEARRRVLAGEPLQYVVGEWDFAGLSFYVDSRVLIPRPETELLVEKALEVSGNNAKALDVCTGSGCVAVALAKLGGLRVTASDVSPEALEVARHNAVRQGVDVAFVCGDMFSAVEGRFDVITCNPPYIRSGDIAGLEAEVRREPRLALDGGGDGLDFYRVIADQAGAYLAEGGTLLLEVGFGQAAQVCGLLAGGGLGDIQVFKDCAGIDRVVVARRIGCSRN